MRKIYEKLINRLSFNALKMIPIEMTVVDDMVNLIDEFFNDRCNRKYKLNKYTDIEIDEVNVDVFIEIHHNRKVSYSLSIVSKNVYVEDYAFVIFTSDYCETIREILELLVTMNNEYLFMDYLLLPPTEIKHAKLQRKMFPLSPDKNCSVCCEPTTENTLCNHYLCFKCRELCIYKGKNNNCPICRSPCLDIYPEN